MKWFEGSIPEAVTASKLKKAVFVVFVEGKDDVSQKVAETLNSTEVSSRLETDDFVSIKLQSDSENYTFFAQIYQLVPVPSIFFIGNTGAPLEIIGSYLSSSDLALKIDSILLKAKPQAATNSSANLIDAEQKAHSSSSNQNTNQSTSNISTTPASTSGLSQSPKESVSDSQTSSNVPTTTQTSPPGLSQEEKVQRAKELMELQKRQKLEEEERKEREREVERRKTGRDVQKMRQETQDREIKEALAERLKEKAAENAAREKILKQIAEDKLERKRKYEMHKQEQSVQQEKAQEEAQARAQAAARAAATDMLKTRIQFKLPTGNSITGTFEASDALGSLRTYVVQNTQLPFRQFSMSSFFPRKDFTTDDDNKSLLELELVPSSVILILPGKSGNSASVIKSSDGAGIFSHFFWTLLAPVVSMYNFIVGYFTGRPRPGGNDNSNDNRNPENNANITFGRITNMAARSRLGGQGTSKIRARGNIHSLHSGDDDNDENNTWNGNSTQQM